MFSRFELFIDVLADSTDFSTITDIIARYNHLCAPVFRKIADWDFPPCKYDLLVVDAKHLPLGDEQLLLILTYYEDVVVINTTTDAAYYDYLYNHGITHWLKVGYTALDWLAFFQNFVKSKKMATEKDILDKLIHSAENSVVITDKSGNIEYANPYFEKVSGFRRDELVTRSPNVIKSGFHDDVFYKNLWQKITNKEVWDGIFVNKNKAGERFYEEATISPILTHHGEIDRFLKIGKNITRERLLLDELASEVKLARKVVDALLPKNYKDSQIQMQYELMHHNEIGGDFVFFQKASAYKYHFALIDVMGHGVSAALVAITVIQMFADYIQFNSLETSVNAINRFLCLFNDDQEDRGHFVTGTFASFDFKAKTGKLINAGHNDTIASTCEGTIEKLPSNNMLLGVVYGFHYELYTFSLTRYTQLFFFTDGLYENQALTYQEAVDIIGTVLKDSSRDKALQNVFKAFKPSGDDVTAANIILNGPF